MVCKRAPARSCSTRSSSILNVVVTSEGGHAVSPDTASVVASGVLVQVTIRDGERLRRGDASGSTTIVVGRVGSERSFLQTKSENRGTLHLCR